MRALLQQIAIGIRLHLRNRMALAYSFLFPAIFLLAFRILYRSERVPLLLHAGEFLTVAILGGTCFGLPLGIVEDRERGVLRRYRMLPVSQFAVPGGILITRYLLLLIAGILQLALAFAAGMPAPPHPFHLWIAFTASCGAFLAVGLVLATLASTVPAAQALGQCTFLPMLVIGGVAIPLYSLPNWAQRISSFLPGRYAVEAMQAAMSAGPHPSTHFDFVALAAIAAAGALAAFLAFRWDTAQPISPWIAIALAAWLAVGLAWKPRTPPSLEPIAREELRAPAEFTPPSAAPSTVPTATWRDVTLHDLANVAFDRLPKDDGVIAPIAAPGDEPDAETAAQLDRIYAALPGWPPGKNRDPVQRVRNLLYIAAVADIYRMDPLERFLPYAVFDQIQRAAPTNDLSQILYFIALHPNDGDDSAARRMAAFNLPDAPRDTRSLRNRAMIYSFKFLARLSRNRP
ncbi:MAG TPA: ABC transporter permease [Bryobacteraceae bacterium]|nr:ABC transporter permease [Bryobacteraceae bacterium]